MDKDDPLYHKETFYQPAYDGIPGHWVVQYYIGNHPFPQAAYFTTQKEAEEFEKELVGIK